MSKLASFLRAIETADEAITEIEKHIDLTRLIGLSNAQGSLASLVRGAVEQAIKFPDRQPTAPPKAKLPPKVKKPKSRKSRQIKSAPV